MVELRIELLGRFRVRLDDKVVPGQTWRLRKAAAVIKLLALAPRHRLHRDQLVESLWPEFEPEAAANNLRVTLSAARRPLLAANAQISWLSHDGDQVRLAPEAEVGTDVAEFQSLAAAARHLGDLAALQRAVDAYTDELLPDDRYEDWAATAREELRQTWFGLLDDLARAHVAQGEPDAAIATWRRLIDHDPTRESPHLDIMRLWGSLGEVARALDQYDQLRLLLRQRLDAEPTPAAANLAQHLREHTGHLEPVHRRVRPPAAGLALVSEAAPPSRQLPAALTRFVGRQSEVSEVTALLKRARLVTLTGPGGVGKTRLALQAATDFADAEAGSVWWLDLAAVNDDASFAAALLMTLGLHEEPKRPPIETVVSFLRTMPIPPGRPGPLLVFDNCEHTLTPSATIAVHLLQQCPRLQILATSRQSLEVLGEAVWAVPVMRLPEPFSAIEDFELDRIAAADAVQLLVDRLELVQSGFLLQADNAAAVVEVCRRLDGLPLAIELAAAHGRSLSIGEIAQQLDHRLQLLQRGNRGGPARQQTLAAMLDWSHDRLNVGDKFVFRRLAVFAGGFTIEAAEAVILDPSAAPSTIAEAIARLVDQSLVQRDASFGSARYRLLETTREYAEARLIESGETETVCARHLQFCLTFARSANDHLHGPTPAAWLDWLAAEHDNLICAMDWARSHQPALGLALALATCQFWRLRGWSTVGRDWLSQLCDAAAREMSIDMPDLARSRLLVEARIAAATIALAQNRADEALIEAQRAVDEAVALDEPRVIAPALDCRANARLSLGEFRQAAADIDQALGIWRRLADPRGLGSALLAGTGCYGLLGEIDRAATLEAEAFEIFDRLADPRGTSVVWHNRGLRLHWRGDLPAATAALTKSIALRRAIGDRPGLAKGLHVLAGVYREQGDLVEAERCGQECLAIYQSLGGRLSTAQAHNVLGIVANDVGDLDRAEEHLSASLALSQELGDRRGAAVATNNLARVASDRSDLPRAMTLYQQSLAIHQELGNRRGQAFALNNLGNIALDLGDFGAARTWLNQAIELRRLLDDRVGMASTLNNLGALAVLQGDSRVAAGYLAKALDLAFHASDQRKISTALSYAAGVAGQTGEFRLGARLLAAAGTLYRQMAQHSTPGYERQRADILALIRPGLDATALARELAIGADWSVEQAVSAARACLAKAANPDHP